MELQSIKARSKRLSSYFETYSCYDGYIGKVISIWVSTEIGHSKSGREQSVGHSKEYIKTVFDRNDGLIGHKVNVRIVSVSKFHMFGVCV